MISLLSLRWGMKPGYGRVWLIIALFLLYATSLPASSATIYRSNSIGLRLQEITESLEQQFDYVLRVRYPDTLTTEESLYKNDILVQNTVVTRSAVPFEEKTVVQVHYDESGRELSLMRSVYDGNMLNQRSQTDEFGSMVSFFTYENGRMVSQRDLYNGDFHKLITYHRNATDGALVGIRVLTAGENPVVQFFGGVDGADMYAEGDTESFTITTMLEGKVPATQTWLNSKVVLSATVIYDEDGNLVVSEESPDGLVKKTYDARGLLVHESWLTGDSIGTMVDYVYDDSGLLTYSRKEIPSTLPKVIERWYADEVLLSIKEWEGTLQVKSVQYLVHGGSIVTLFDNGRPYADVTYAGDGRRVISVVYREDT
jgi:YD repeat-containing protein